MKPIQTWEYKSNFHEFSISLYKDKLSYIRKVQGNILTNEYSIKELFQRRYPIVEVDFDFQIYKKLSELKQPGGLSEFESKVWQFWKAFNNNKLTEEKIYFDEKHYRAKTKVGFAEGQKRYNSKDRLYPWQSIVNFYFYGPFRYGISSEDRIRIKQEIFNCLEPSKHKLSIDDGFILFDYSKIKPISFTSETGTTGKYFKVKGGKCTVGGWDNSRDGAENYTSVEYLWYNLNTRVPTEFRSSIQEIRLILEKAIVS